MKRLLVYGTLALLLGGMFAARAGLKWLLETPAGVTWLFREVSLRTSLTLSARTITGGLGTHLRMTGVTAAWPGGDLAIDDVRLRWQPFFIPLGNVVIRELDIRGGRFHDTSVPEGGPPGFIWPRLTGIPARIDVWIDTLCVTGCSWQRGRAPTTPLPSLVTALSLRHGRLQLADLSLVAPEGRITGALTAGFDHPALTAVLALEPARPVVGCTRFDFRAGLQPGSGQDQVAGTVSAVGRVGRNQRYALEGQLALSGKDLCLRGAKLVESGRSGVLEGEGRWSLADAPRLRLVLRARGVDLSREAGAPLTLSGKVLVAGDLPHYAGRFALESGGERWRAGRLQGGFSGDRSGVALTGIEAQMLDGRVTGNLGLAWRDHLDVTARVRGEGIDPAGIAPEWGGTLNFDLDGRAAWSDGGVRQATVRGRLRESRFRGEALSGEISASLAGEDLRIHRLFLAGNGFRIHADGRPRQRFVLAATISDLSAIVPGTGGRLALSGWGRYAGGTVSGVVSGEGHQLTGAGVRAASARLNVDLNDAVTGSGSLTTQLRGITGHGLTVDGIDLTASGSVRRHRLDLALRSAGARIRGVIVGGSARGYWQGKLSEFSGSDDRGGWRLSAPVAITASPLMVEVSPLVVAGTGTERLELSGRLFLKPLRGSMQAAWSNLDLARGDRWLTEARLAGESSGSLRLESPAGSRVHLVGRAAVAGTVTLPHRVVTVRKGVVELNAGADGIHSLVELRTGEGVSLTGRFVSSDPAVLAFPRQGEVSASWQGVETALARKWLPSGVDLQGRLSGSLAGRLLPERRLDLHGTVRLDGGGVVWRRAGKELAASVRRAAVDWDWNREALRGTLALTLATYGEATGNFSIPLPARIVTAPIPTGAVRATLRGRIQEKGLVTVLFPGVVRESRGDASFDVRCGGSWRVPDVTGVVTLSGASAYLPTAGIMVKDMGLTARLEGGEVRIDPFRISSGNGSLSGAAVLRMEGTRLAGYRGTLTGERFQAVRLPELQLTVDPELTFEGGGDRLSVRGVMRVPELLVDDGTSRNVIRPSKDVVLTKGGAASGATTPRIRPDIRIGVLLGDRVVVKSEGLDATLGGRVTLSSDRPGVFTGSGEISVTRGWYRIYGVTLDIRRGRLLFAGGPVQRPTLDILALREVGDVKAGVTVTGTPDVPVVKLYSDPVMPDVEALSYVVFGHKLGDWPEQGSRLMQAASVLASAGESPYLQEQLKQRLGIDTIGIATNTSRTSGYRNIEPLYGTSPKSTGTPVSQTLLQVGKYLTPDLYVSYGWSLFNDIHQVRVRYSLSKQVELESRASAAATSGDIFYRIEFE